MLLISIAIPATIRALVNAVSAVVAAVISPFIAVIPAIIEPAKPMFIRLLPIILPFPRGETDPSLSTMAPLSAYTVGGSKTSPGMARTIGLGPLPIGNRIPGCIPAAILPLGPNAPVVLGTSAEVPEDPLAGNPSGVYLGVARTPPCTGLFPDLYPGE